MKAFHNVYRFIELALTSIYWKYSDRGSFIEYTHKVEDIYNAGLQGSEW